MMVNHARPISEATELDTPPTGSVVAVGGAAWTEGMPRRVSAASVTAMRFFFMVRLSVGNVVGHRCKHA